jgi:hypothetical protein
MDKITAFVDSVGRTIIGRVTSDTTKQLTVTNPAIVSMNVQQDTGQISVQLLPYVFAEFIAEDVRNNVSWSFNKQTLVTSSNIKLDNRILQQYVQIIENPPVMQPQPVQQPVDNQNEPEVVKLFDDE